MKYKYGKKLQENLRPGDEIWSPNSNSYRCIRRVVVYREPSNLQDRVCCYFQDSFTESAAYYKVNYRRQQVLV